MNRIEAGFDPTELGEQKKEFPNGYAHFGPDGKIGDGNKTE